MTDTFLIRFATAADYENVLEISRGIDGGRHDYLPHVFHKWLKDPQHLVFLGISESQIVGLLTAFITDKNTTVIYLAKRIGDKYKGRGFSSKLESRVHLYVRDYFPSVVKTRFAMGVGNISNLVHSIFLNKGNSVITEKGMISFYKEDKSSAQNFGNIKQKLFSCSKYIFDKLLFTATDSRIFEQNLFVIDWIPYKVIPENFDQMFKSDDYILIDINPFSEEGLANKCKITSISHGRLSPRIAYPHWTVTVCTKDEGLLKSHLMYQFQKAVNIIGKRFLFVAIVCKEMRAFGAKYLTNLLGQEEFPNYSFSMKVYESDFM